MSDEREPTEEEWIAALRQYGWLRDDGERFHTTRPLLARNDEERCKGFYRRVCAYRDGHPGPHKEAKG